MLDIVKTKDDKFLIFSPISTNKITAFTIQNENLEEVSYLDIFTLEEALDILKDYQEKIILNLLPLNEAVVVEEYEKIVLENKHYLEELEKILTNYQQLCLYVCSVSYNLLYHIKTLPNIKIGVLLSSANSNYIDVDFYVFPSELLNEKILLQQLDISKEVMIQMQDCDDISLVVSFLKEKMQQKKRAEEFQFITNYPNVFGCLQL